MRYDHFAGRKTGRKTQRRRNKMKKNWAYEISINGVGTISYGRDYFVRAGIVNPLTAAPYTKDEIADIVDSAAEGVKGYTFDLPENRRAGHERLLVRRGKRRCHHRPCRSADPGQGRRILCRRRDESRCAHRGMIQADCLKPRPAVCRGFCMSGTGASPFQQASMMLCCVCLENGRE